MKQKRILIIHPALAPYRIDFFNYLYDTYDVHIIFLRDNLYSFQFDQEELRSQLNGSFEFRTQGLNVRSTILYRKGIIQVIKKFQPDIVVTHEYAMNSYQVAGYKLIKRNFKHLIWTADNIPMLRNMGFLNIRRKQILVKLVDGVSVYNDEVKNLMIKKFGIDKDGIGVFPNIQNENRLNPSTSETTFAALPALLKKLRNEQVILFVGRLAEVKNIPYLITAYKLAQKKGLIAKLVIIGDGPERKLLEDSIQDDQNIFIEGAIQGEKLKSYYKVADLFVLPSFNETFGAVVNEALIYGTPVFCTVNAGAASLIKSGVNGEIFDPQDDPEKLAQMLFNFFKDKAVNRNKQNKPSLMLSPFRAYASKWLPNNLIN